MFCDKWEKGSFHERSFNREMLVKGWSNRFRNSKGSPRESELIVWRQFHYVIFNLSFGRFN